VAFVTACSFFKAEGEQFRRIGWRDDVSIGRHQQMGSNSGEFSPGKDFPDLSPVGVVHSKNGSIGTGTLISPTLVVTAAHVLRGSKRAPVPNASNWFFSLGYDYENPTSVHSVSEVIIHPGWTQRLPYENGVGDGDVLGVDLALLRLREPISNLVAARWNTGSRESLGSRVIMAGYGSLAQGSQGVTEEDNYLRLAGENSIDRVVETVDAPGVPLSFRGGLLGVDFDDPQGFYNSLGAHSSPVDYLGSGTSSSIPLTYEATTAQGDSGGPAFLFLDGAWRVVGTVSYGTKKSKYGDVTVYSRLASQSSWLLTNLERWSPALRIGSGEWLNLDWFGAFLDLDGEWIFHSKLGWLFVSGNQPDEFWAWRKGVGWFWTGLLHFPFVYADQKNEWIYFSRDSSNPNTLFFFDYSKGEWEKVVD